MNDVIKIRQEIASKKPKEWSHDEVEKMLFKLCTTPHLGVKDAIFAIAETHNMQSIKNLEYGNWEELK